MQFDREALLGCGGDLKRPPLVRPLIVDFEFEVSERRESLPFLLS